MHDEVMEGVGDFLEGTTDYNDCPPFGVVNWAFEDWCISTLVEEFLDAEIAIGPTTCRILSFREIVLDEWCRNQRQCRANEEYLGCTFADDVRRSVNELLVTFQKLHQSGYIKNTS